MKNMMVPLGIFVTIGVLATLASIARRLRSVEYKLLAVLRHVELVPRLQHEPSERVRQIAADPKRKIEAIKVLREESGLELKEAKKIIEELTATQGFTRV